MKILHLLNIAKEYQPMPGPLPPHDALIYIMVTMSAVDRDMTDKELMRIGHMVKNLPVFEGFDTDQLVTISKSCGDLLSHEDGLDQILSDVTKHLPEKLYETAYALALEVAAADLYVKDEEIRFLQMLRDALELDSLVCAAIERGTKARHARI